MRHVGIQVNEAAGRLEALGVELLPTASDAAQARGDRGVELRQPAVALPGRAVAGDERRIGDRGIERVAAERERLREVLVIDPDRQRVEQLALGGQGQHRARADHLAGADHIGAADGCHRAVGFQAVDENVQPVDVGPRHVGAGDDHGVLPAERRILIGHGHRVAELPEVVVAQRIALAQRRRAGALPVVEFGAAVQRQRVLDVEVDVDGSRRDARPQRRRDAPVRPSVERDDILASPP